MSETWIVLSAVSSAVMLVAFILHLEDWWLVRQAASGYSHLLGCLQSKRRARRQLGDVAAWNTGTRSLIDLPERHRQAKQLRAEMGEALGDAGYGVCYHQVHAAIQLGMPPSQYLNFDAKDRLLIESYLMRHDADYRRMIHEATGRFDAA